MLLYSVDEYSILVMPYENTFVIWIPEDMEAQETYTKFEKVEIMTAYSQYNSASSFWTITLSVKNSGTDQARITNVYLNDVPCSSENYYLTTAPMNSFGTDIPSEGYILGSGESATFMIFIDKGYSMLSSGTTINIKLHSAGGMDYIKLVELV